jgi:hypothetical protein
MLAGWFLGSRARLVERAISIPQEEEPVASEDCVDEEAVRHCLLTEIPAAVGASAEPSVATIQVRVEGKPKQVHHAEMNDLSGYVARGPYIGITLVMLAAR